MFRRVDPDTTKAATPEGGTAFSASQVAALLGSVAVAPQVTGVINPLPRTDPQVAFGPGVPLIPAPIAPVRPDSGRPEPRLTEYPVSSNLPGVTDRLVPWKVLRDAASAGGLPRRCIEIRKAEVATLDWTVTISPGAVEAAQAAAPDASRSEVEAALRDRLGPQIARCEAFWQQPNPREGESFAEWTSKLLEEHLVLDAVAIYPRYTYGGDLFSLEILDGSTIKPLRDSTGGRPQPPQPAYQQILWGFPRGEFVADTDADGSIINGYRSDRLIYKRRNVRAETQYGYSAVEQALEDIDVWLRRRKWIRDEYTEGTVPTGLLRNTGEAGWTPQQTQEYERILNDAYAGQSAARHRLRVLPPGFDLQQMSEFGEKYRPDYDLFLIKQIASHFDVTIAELGFTEPGGLGASGWHEGQADVQQRKGTLPTVRWLQQLITAISRQHLGMPPELEFRFLGLEDEDEAAADAVAAARVATGRMTLNQDRDRMGMPRYAFPEADMPIYFGQRGLVFLDGASKLAPAGTMVVPPQAPAAGQPPGEQPAADGADQSRNDTDESAQAVKAELAAYHRWARKNPNPRRPFEFVHVTKADAPDLADAPVVFAGGEVVGAGPKAPGPAFWAGWERDEDTAEVWARRLARALAETVECDELARRWLARELVKADEPRAPAPPQQDDDEAQEWAVAFAAAFLTAAGLPLAAAIGPVLAGVWAEGYVIGAVSARAHTAGQPGRFAWRPGDTQGALGALTEADREALQRVTDASASLVDDLARGRETVLARVLAAARTGKVTAAQLARSLRQALTDGSWARMTCLTELVRLATEATRQAYTSTGVTVWRWVTEPGACPACLGNETAGALTVGAAFPDGSVGPPAHPRCRCHMTPA